MNRNLTFVVTSLLFWGIGEGMFFNFVPIYLGKEFALGEEQIGLALGTFGFFALIGTYHFTAPRVAGMISLIIGRISAS